MSPDPTDRSNAMKKSTKKSTRSRNLNTEVYEAMCEVIDSQFRMYNGNLRHDARYKVESPSPFFEPDDVQMEMMIENADIRIHITVSNHSYDTRDCADFFAVYANPSVRLGDLNGATLAKYGKMFSLAAEIVEALKVAMKKVQA
jgi:hypothetical protein